MIKNLDKVINNLKHIKKALVNNINTLFFKNSLNWIANRADQLLDSSLSFEPNTFGTNIREWEITILGNYAKLENKYENSAAVEFGIGVVGKENPTDHAQSSHYQYDMRMSTDDEGRWSFYDQKGDFWYKFSGYKGKSFLYNAFMEYKQNDIWKQMYQKAFDEVMRGVIK